MPSPLLEAIAGGITVSPINKLIINSTWLNGCCQNLCYVQQPIEHPDDCSSSTSTTTTLDTDLIHHIPHS